MELAGGAVGVMVRAVGEGGTGGIPTECTTGGCLLPPGSIPLVLFYYPHLTHLLSTKVSMYMHTWDVVVSTIWHFGGKMQLASMDTDMYSKAASCILSNLKIYEIILPNTIY